MIGRAANYETKWKIIIIWCWWLWMGHRVIFERFIEDTSQHQLNKYYFVDVCCSVSNCKLSRAVWNRMRLTDLAWYVENYSINSALRTCTSIDGKRSNAKHWAKSFNENENDELKWSARLCTWSLIMLNNQQFSGQIFHSAFRTAHEQEKIAPIICGIFVWNVNSCGKCKATWTRTHFMKN